MAGRCNLRRQSSFQVILGPRQRAALSVAVLGSFSPPGINLRFMRLMFGATRSNSTGAFENELRLDGFAGRNEQDNDHKKKSRAFRTRWKPKYCV
jgi:hypothetical protein